jgi:hypothetical protein
MCGFRESFKQRVKQHSRDGHKANTFSLNAIMLTNSDWHLLFCVYWLLHFLIFFTEHKSIVNDVFDSHNLMVVTVLSTPHCQ